MSPEHEEHGEHGEHGGDGMIVDRRQLAIVARKLRISAANGSADSK
jgi:hypothetical protein